MHVNLLGRTRTNPTTNSDHFNSDVFPRLLAHATRLNSTNNHEMPETDKHAAAQQAVDILHEIATILVRLSGYFPDNVLASQC